MCRLSDSEEAAARIAVQGGERGCEMQLMQECASVPVGTSVGFSWRGLGRVVGESLLKPKNA